jgi:hypothetical protein
LVLSLLLKTRARYGGLFFWPMDNGIGNDEAIGNEIGSKNQCADERHFVCFMVMLASLLP